MAVGDVTASGGITKEYQKTVAGASGGEATAQLGAALSNLAPAIHQYNMSALGLDKAYDDRLRASQGLQLETDFLDFQKAQGEFATSLVRDKSELPAGLTTDYLSQYDATSKTFLDRVKKINPRFAEEYAAKLKQFRIQQQGELFGTEIKLLDARDNTLLHENLDKLKTSLHNEQTSLEDAKLSWDEFVNKSGLASAEKAALLSSGVSVLESVQFGQEVSAAASGNAPASFDYSGRDAVAPGLTPQQRGLLNSIGFVEGPGYDVLNGGERFDDYSQHPARRGKGGTSTAAGRYQFTYGTWKIASEAYKKAYGVTVPDFSPMWQDRVALFWAEHIYNRYTTSGMSFQQALNSGDPQAIATIRRTLGNPKVAGDPLSVEWQALGDNGDGAKADERFLRNFFGETGVAGGGTGSALAPDIWTDPRFSNISYEDKVRAAASAHSALTSALKSQADAANERAQALRKQVYDAGYSAPQNGEQLINEFKQSLGAEYTVDIDKALREGIAAGAKIQTSVGQVAQKIADGQPLLSGDMDAYDQWFGEENLRGLRTGDEAAWDKLRYGVASTTAIPPAARDALVFAMNNPDTQTQAYEFVAALHKNAPYVLDEAGFSSEVIADAALYDRVARYTDPKTAAERLALLKANALSVPPATAQTEGRKAYAKNVTPASLQKIFGYGAFSRTSEAGLGEGRLAALTADSYQAYLDGYRIYGTEDGAQAYMEETLKKSWGPSEVNGRSILTKYPPENYFPKLKETARVPGQVDALRRIAKDQASRWLVGDIGPELAAGIDVAIVADRTTETDLGSGRVPTYSLVATDPNGVVHVIPKRFGGDRVREVLESLAIDSAEDTRKQANKEAVVEEISTATADIDKAVASGDTELVKELTYNVTRLKQEQQALADEELPWPLNQGSEEDQEEYRKRRLQFRRDREAAGYGAPDPAKLVAQAEENEAIRSTVTSSWEEARALAAESLQLFTGATSAEDVQTAQEMYARAKAMWDEAEKTYVDTNGDIDYSELESAIGVTGRFPALPAPTLPRETSEQAFARLQRVRAANEAQAKSAKQKQAASDAASLLKDFARDNLSLGSKERKALERETFAIVREERKASGGRYNQPEAELIAVQRLFARLTGMTEDEVLNYAKQYLNGTLR